jgi:hypothetical protein
LLIVGTGLTLAPLDPVRAETKKEFIAEEKAEKKAFKAEEKAERKAFNATHLTAAQRCAFNAEERTEKQTFKSQEKAFKAGPVGKIQPELYNRLRKVRPDLLRVRQV